MGFKKFIKNVKEFLNIDEFDTHKKKKAVKKLLNKLEKRKVEIKKLLDKDLNSKEREEVLEEFEILKYQIKKGEKLLDKLEKNK